MRINLVNRGTGEIRQLISENSNDLGHFLRKISRFDKKMKANLSDDLNSYIAYELMPDPFSYDNYMTFIDIKDLRKKVRELYKED